MKTKIILFSFLALTLAAAVAVMKSGRHQPGITSLPAGAQTFTVHGQIREVDTARKTVRIAHEAIPDYMPAMTMPFAVKDAALLRGLSAGDSVQFELAVTADDSWISHLEKIRSAAVEDAVALRTAASASTSDTGSSAVAVGAKVPDFKLIDQNGQPFRLGDFHGKAVVLTFIYTRCPLPNFCPLMSKNFADLQQRLSKGMPDRCQLLSVTMDPEFDQPEVLKNYAARYEADGKSWRFATGDEDQIDFVADLMGLFREPENGLIAHNLRTALIGPDGRLVHVWKSNVWTPLEVQRLVAETLGKENNYAAAR